MTDKEANELILTELKLARQKYSDFTSAHEGWAVIRERVDNLWAEVKRPALLRDKSQLRAEAARTGAMALRFLVDVVRDL